VIVLALIVAALILLAGSLNSAAQAIVMTLLSVLTPLLVYLAQWLARKLTPWKVGSDTEAFVLSFVATFVVATAAYFVTGGSVKWSDPASIYDVGAKVFTFSQVAFWLVYKPIIAALTAPPPLAGKPSS